MLNCTRCSLRKKYQLLDMSKYSSDNKKSIAEEGPRFYSSPEEQEMARLKEAINRSDSEKFFFLMNLMKLQQAMQKGKLHHKD